MAGAVADGDVFGLSNDERRRHVVRGLTAPGPPSETGDVAVSVAAIEHGKERSAVTAEERRRVYNTLQQRQPDRPEEAGAISHERGRVEPTERIEKLQGGNDSAASDALIDPTPNSDPAESNGTGITLSCDVTIKDATS